MSRITRQLSLLFIVTFSLTFAAPSYAQQSTHTVQPGENLFRIALNYGLSTAELAAANGINDPTVIYVGQVLVIPLPGSAPAAVSASVPAVEAPAPAATQHVVARGEKLGDIAQRYGMTVAELAALNGIFNPNLIFVGQVLTVNSTAAPSVPVAAAPVPAAQPSQTTYVVQPGDHLAAIAARYGVSWVEIATVNGITTPDRVFAGTQLTIPAPGSVTAVDYNAYVASTAPAAPTGVGREILVDLSDSRIYAYENGVLMRNALGSMGRAATPTVVGNFTVQRKYVTSDMSGPGYYLSGVPYTMYFYQGYAIHGTYWHSNWGVPMSHGCVNLPPSEAEWFFGFAPLGTPVRVQV